MSIPENADWNSPHRAEAVPKTDDGMGGHAVVPDGLATIGNLSNSVGRVLNDVAALVETRGAGNSPIVYASAQSEPPAGDNRGGLPNNGNGGAPNDGDAGGPLDGANGNGDGGGDIRPPGGGTDDNGGPLDWGRENAGKIIRQVGELVQKFDDHLNIDKQVDSLNSDGDAMTLKIGGKVALGFGGTASGNIEVRQVGDGPNAEFIVRGTGSAGVSYDSPLENDIPGLQTRGNIGIVGEPTAEYKFDNKEDATRAAQIMRQTAYAAAAGAAAGTATAKVNPLLAPFAASLASGAVAPSDQDIAFLEQNVTAYEFKIAGSGNIAAELGFKLDDGKGDNLGFGKLGADLNGQASSRVRLTLPQDGEPAKLSLLQDVSIKADIAARMTPSLTENDKKDGVSKAGDFYTLFKGSNKLNLTVEHAIDLPADANLDKLMDRPLEEIARYIEEGGDTWTTTAKIGGETDDNTEISAQISGKPLVIADAIKSLPENGLRETLNTLGDEVTLNLKANKVDRTGLNNSHGIKIAGVGFTISGTAQTADRTPLVNWSNQPDAQLPPADNPGLPPDRPGLPPNEGPDQALPPAS